MPWVEGEALTPTNLNALSGLSVAFYSSAYSENAQNTINAAAAAGGGVALLSPSVFTLSSVLTLASNVILAGSGRSTVLRAANAYSATTLLYASGISNWAVRDLVLNGNRSNSSTQAYLFNLQSNASDGLIDNVLLTNGSADGINGVACHRIVVRNCEVSNMSTQGILFGNNAGGPNSTGILVVGCSITSCGAGGIVYYQEITDSAIIGSRVSTCDNGIRLIVGATGSAASVARIKIADNSVSYCNTDGIRLMGRDHTCIGNSSYNNGNSGIKTGGSAGADPNTFTNSVIANNSCNSNANQGIGIVDRQQDFNVIMGNTVSDNSGHGIAFTSFNSSNGTVQGCSIVGNVVQRNGLNGIVLTSGQSYVYFTIANNVCVNNGVKVFGNAGISAETTFWTTFTGNTCYDNQSSQSQGYGINIISGDSNCITGNIVRNIDSVSSGLSFAGTHNEVGHNIQ